jgi:hypothetical protein
MVSTNEGSEFLTQSSKVQGTDVCNRNPPYMAFRRRPISAPPQDLDAPSVVAVLFAGGVEPQTPCRLARLHVLLLLVDVERALFRRNVSRLSAASSNASLSPPIYPRTLLAATYPRHIGSAPRTRESSRSMYSRKQNQIVQMGDLGAGVRLFVFHNPPYTASRKMSITRTAGACTSL